MPRLHGLGAFRDHLNANPRPVVELLPLSIDRSARSTACEEDFDISPRARQRERDEGRRRADPVARISEQLVSDEDDPP